jgi:hypothetical protein
VRLTQNSEVLEHHAREQQGLIGLQPPEANAPNAGRAKLDGCRRVLIEAAFAEKCSVGLLLNLHELNLGQNRGVEDIAHQASRFDIALNWIVGVNSSLALSRASYWAD